MKKKLHQKKRSNGAGAKVPAPSHFDPLKCLALYSGQILLGHLLHCSCGVEAFIDGKSIGTFSTQRAASAALGAKAASHE
jgi:hypothetical protein